MRWLSKIFDYVPAHERKGISLDERNCWLIDFKKSDIALFIREMGMLFPQGSTIYLEGTAIVSGIQEYLGSIRAEETTKLEMGTIWPRPKIFHVPLVDEHLQRLAEFTDTHAMAEVCDHLHVYKDDEVLLQGYDIWDKVVYVSGKTGEGPIKDFCARVDCKYRKENDGT
jgi:hypothetical protein